MSPLLLHRRHHLRFHRRPRPSRRRRACALLALAIALPGIPAVAWADAVAGCSRGEIDKGTRMERSIQVGDSTRRFLLDVPASLRAGQSAPLLLFFHGFGHSAEGLSERSPLRALAAQHGFIVAYPDGLPVRLLGRNAPGWEIFRSEGNRDVAFVQALLTKLEEQYCIDRTRIYSTGFSNGGFFSNLLGCELADRIAAIAPVAGGRIMTGCNPKRPVPVILHHGRSDSVVPVGGARQARDTWIQTNTCGNTTEVDGCSHYSGCAAGAEVIYCENDGEHRWPPQAAQRIVDFFRRHSLN